MSDSQPLLSVRDLMVEASSPDGPVRLIDCVSFDVAANDVLGLVGESGSGKSVTMLAVMGLLPAGLRLVRGEIRLRGRDIAGLSLNALRAIRGRELSMIFQDPMTSLNPVRRVGSQIAETIRVHNPALSRGAIRDRVVELLVERRNSGRAASRHPVSQ